MSYTHEMIIRDVVYYLHECAAYQSIAYDLDYTPLLGPYWEYFDDEEELVREGAMLIFIGMLREWLSHAGFPFGTSPDGVCAHPFPSYLTSLIAAYERAHSAQDPAARRLYKVALSLCAHLQRDATLNRRIADLSPEVLARLQAYSGEGSRSIGEWNAVFMDLYESYGRPYFVARAM